MERAKFPERTKTPLHYSQNIHISVRLSNKQKKKQQQQQNEYAESDYFGSIKIWLGKDVINTTGGYVLL